MNQIDSVRLEASPNCRKFPINVDAIELEFFTQIHYGIGKHTSGAIGARHHRERCAAQITDREKHFELGIAIFEHCNTTISKLSQQGRRKVNWFFHSCESITHNGLTFPCLRAAFPLQPNRSDEL